MSRSEQKKASSSLPHLLQAACAKHVVATTESEECKAPLSG
jgi:hypothetical protein